MIDEKIPPALFDLQKWIGELVFKPLRKTDSIRLPLYEEKVQEQIELRVKETAPFSARQRIGLYNQQFWFRLFVVLQGRYPSLTRLFGYREFNCTLAEPYLLKHPPSCSYITFEGGTLPAWIEADYAQEDREFLFQLAQLDDYYYRLEFVQRLPMPSHFEPTISLGLQPDVGVFVLDADLFAFREALLKEPPPHWEKEPFPQVDWLEKTFFIAYRKGKEVRVEKVDSAQGKVLQALQKKEALALDAKPWWDKWREKELLALI